MSKVLSCFIRPLVPRRGSGSWVKETFILWFFTRLWYSSLVEMVLLILG